MSKPSKPANAPEREFFAARFADNATDAAEGRPVVWYSGEKVERYDYWSDEKFYMELSLDPKAVRLERLNERGKVFDSHMTFALEHLLGIVVNGSAAVDGKQGVASMRLSDREEVQRIEKDIDAGIITDVSVGFTIHATEDVTKEGEEFRTIRVTDYEPTEISIVPIGAASDAGFAFSTALNRAPGAHQEALPMADNTDKTDAKGQQVELIEETQPSPKAPEPTVINLTDDQRKEAAAKATDAERSRISGIADRVKAAGLEQSFADELVKGGVSLQDASDAIFAKLAEKSAETRVDGRVEVTRDGQETFREGAMDHLQFRAGAVKELSEKGRAYQFDSLMDLARECVQRSGGRARGMDKYGIVHQAFHATADFPSILQNTASKSLADAYAEFPQTFQAWTNQRDLPNFQTHSKTKFGEAAQFDEIPENGQIKSATIADDREEVSLATYGKAIPIGRQAIINDDLDAFSRIPQKFGREARQTESDVVYSVLTDNAAMRDTNALFGAAHLNIDTTSGSAVPTEGTIEIGKVAMADQTEIVRSGLGLTGRKLDIQPEYIIVPRSSELETRKLLGDYQYLPGDPTVTPYRNMLTIIVDHRITTGFYLVANPAMIDTVDWGYLAGSPGVNIETTQNGEIDGIRVAAWIDFYAGAVEHRGLFWNDAT